MKYPPHAAPHPQHGLPTVQEIVLDMRWVAHNDDWWHRTATGWYWFDARTKQWRPAPNGP